MKTRKLFSSILFVWILLAACTATAPQTALPISPTMTAPTEIASTPTAVPGLTTFSSKVFELPMTVSFGQRDWHVSDDYPDLVTIDSSQGGWGVSFNLVSDAKLADPTSGQLIPFPEDFVNWIQSDPDFKANQPTQVTIGGMEGIQVDATPVWTSTTAQKKQFLVLHFNDWNLVPNPERWRFIYLDDVNGERLLIQLIAPADQFDTAIEQTQTVLDTVQFSK